MRAMGERGRMIQNLKLWKCQAVSAAAFAVFAAY